MKRRFLPLFILPLCLAGCQKGNGTGDFPFVDVEGNAYMTRNGDNFGKGGLSHSYPSMCRVSSKNRLEDALSNNRPIFLFFEQEGCPACDNAHNDLTNFFLSSLIEVENFHFTPENQAALVNELNAFKQAHPLIAKELGSYITTPSVYLIKSEEKTLYLDFLSQRESLQNLYDYFKGLINFTLVYNFQSYDSFTRFYEKNDCLVYMDEVGSSSKGFYQDVYPTAKHSQKMTAHIETASVSEADKARFDTLLPQKTYIAEKGGLRPVSSDSILDYYA